MATIGRNQPCPCGSGKKYKHCCLKREEQKAQQNRALEVNRAREFNELLQEAVGDQQFESMDELQAFIDGFAQQRNTQGLDDFAGLSPEQVHQLSEQPFDSPELLTFDTDAVQHAEQAPLLLLCHELASAIGETGLKPTAKGNLPRKVCQSIAQHYYEVYPQAYWGADNIHKEEDFYDLHLARILLQICGLMRKYQGKFVLTKKMKQILAAENSCSALYRILLQAYCTEFNWAYNSGDQGLMYIRKAFNFSLYLLKQNGGDFVDCEQYASQFLQAFPALLQEVSDADDYDQAESVVRDTYTRWMWDHFGFYFGLVERDDFQDGLVLVQQIRQSSLFKQLVNFNC